MQFQAEPFMQLGALAAAFYSADQSGVFLRLKQQPTSANGLAQILSLDERALFLVLDILETQGLLQKEQDQYSLSPLLLENMVGPMLSQGFWSNFWGKTSSFLQSGRGHKWCETTEDRAALYSDGVVYLSVKFALEAKRLATILSETLSENPDVLDIGAGAGSWSLQFIKHHQKGHATGLDLAPVTNRFLEHAAKLEVGSRAHTIAGDYFTADVLLDSFDAILFANVLHLETKEKARQLLLRWVPALKQSGKIVVVDMVEDPTNSEQQKVRAAYALHLSLRVPGARVHPKQEIFHWMKEAGATRCSEHLLAESGLTALIGHL